MIEKKTTKTTRIQMRIVVKSLFFQAIFYASMILDEGKGHTCIVRRINIIDLIYI